MSRTVRVGIVIGLIVVMAASLGAVLLTGNGNSAVPEPTSTASEPVATSSPSPASETPLAVPTPDLTGDDYERIFREMVAFRDWLHRYPRPELAELIYHPRCDCHEDLVQELEALVRDAEHFEDEGFRVLSVEVVEETDAVVRVEAVLKRTPQRLVNADGEPVATSTGAPPLTLSAALIREGSPAWRVVSLTALEGGQA